MNEAFIPADDDGETFVIGERVIGLELDEIPFRFNLRKVLA